MCHNAEPVLSFEFQIARSPCWSSSRHRPTVQKVDQRCNQTKPDAIWMSEDGMVWVLGMLSLILKSLIKSLMPKAPVGASIRLLHSKGCCWCFRWIALALVVILRCDWPLWDFSFRSYEHFKIIICLRTIIVTLSRPFWLSIQDISINEVLFLPKVW